MALPTLDRVASVAMLVASIVMVGTSVALIWNRHAGDAEPRAPLSPGARSRDLVGEVVSTRDTTVTGSPTAFAGLVVYTDVECPFCRRLATETLPELRRRYVDNGKAFMAVKHLPLEQIHKAAFRLAESLECAGRQGRFWAVHDRLFAVQDSDVERAVVDVAQHAGVPDVGQFRDCWFSGAAASIVRHDLAEARRLGITGTPTILLGTREGNGMRVVAARPGFVPVAAISATLDQLLARALPVGQQ